MQHTSCNQMIL